MLERYFRLPGALGIHIRQGNDGVPKYFVCLVKAQGHLIDIVSKHENISDVKDLSSKISKEPASVALVFSGRQVIVKKLERSEQHPTEESFKQAMPGAKPDEFYIQYSHTPGHTWICIVRRSVIDDHLKKLAEHGIRVVLLTLGPFSLYPIIAQLNSYGDHIQLGGVSIHRNEQNGWEQVVQDDRLRATFPVKIGDEKIGEDLIIPYSAAFQLLMANEMPPVSAEVPQLTSTLNDELLTRKYTVIGAIALGTLFLVLLINFFLFDHFHTQNETLSAQIGQRDRDLSSEANTDKDLRKKESLLDSLGYDGGIDQARLIDGIAKALPSEVTWERADIYPLVIDDGQQLGNAHFSDHEIRIKGRSAHIIAVNEWIARLQSEKWIRSVHLEDYRFNNESQTGQFHVKIKF